MRNKKKRGCCLFASAKWLLIITFMFITMVLIQSSFDNSAPDTPANTEPSVTMPLETPAPASTPIPTKQPETPEEWVQLAAEEVYRDDLISITWQEVDNQKDMIVIWCKFADNFTNNMRRTVFMGDAKDMFCRVAELGKAGRIDYGSCYIVGRTTYLDKYGNEFDGNAMEIRLTATDLEKINWDNINSNMLIDLATTYAVHPLFRD